MLDTSGFVRTPAATRLSNLAWEWRLGIHTRGIVDVEHADAYHYASMSYATILRTLRFLDLRAQDVFVDIGSGKGRVLCCAALQPLRQVLGIEFSAPLCEQARRNALRLRGRRAPVAVHQGLAQDFDYASATAILLFNPFGAETLDAVLHKIRSDKALAGGAAGLRLAYANPAHESVFLSHPDLTRYASWTAGEDSTEHAISFYRLR